MGLQNVTSGEIIIDNKNIRDLSNQWLNNVSYVPQSIYLFDDTIKNNIILGRMKKILIKTDFLSL